MFEMHLGNVRLEAHPVRSGAQSKRRRLFPGFAGDKVRTMKAFKRLTYFFLPIPFAAVAVAQEKSIRVGYVECLSATNYPKATAEKIAQLKWYFAHASVGANMVDGISDLHGMDKGR